MEEGTAQGTGTAEGQAAEGTEGIQTTQGAPGSTEGQSGAGQAGQTTVQGTGPASEETFFDPASIQDKPELLSAYKQMQRAFSRKNDSIKAAREKIEAYDAFTQDPIGNLQRIAGQYGYTLGRAGASNDQGQQQGAWEPKTWEDVIARAKQEAREEVMKEFEPIFGQVQTLQKSNMETMLDQTCPDWRQYEDDMVANLRKHPSLVNDPAKLYMISVPSEVLESRATQKALQKLQTKAESSQVAGKSTTTKQASGKDFEKVASFDDAVKVAKAKLAEQGIRHPGA